MSKLDCEMELEFESELEQKQARGRPRRERGALPPSVFFNHLAAMADRGGRSQGLRRVALAAAREALRGAARTQPAVEGEFEAEFEGELEGEFEGEFELELDPGRRAQIGATLEHMAHAASEAASEQEAAEQFLPLIPLAAKFALPLVARALPAASRALAKAAPKVLRKVAPSLTKGVGRLTRSLYRNPSTRPLLRAVPRIARTTMHALGRRAARGKAITPRIAARTLARQTARTLSSPQKLAQSYRRSVIADGRYHARGPGHVAVGPGSVPRHLHCPTCGQVR